MIIYPPLIKESAPAFLYHDVVVGSKPASKIIIPFEWNPAVPKAAGISLKLLIKEYFTSTIIDTNIVTTPANSAAAIFYVKDIDYTIDNITYTFPTIGQYYKFQIAYDDGTSQELVYSSVALGRCISSNMVLLITDMEETQTDQVSVMENCVDYKGIYLRDLLNEPLYSYLFEFKDLFGNVLESSGEIIWNNENDEKRGLKFCSISIYHLKYEPQIGQTYTIDFTITTINGYSTTVSRTIIKQLEESSIYDLKVKAVPNHDDGYIKLGIEKNTSQINGQFSLERKEINAFTWETITTIKLGTNSDISQWSWKDFSVKLDTEYQYRIKQFNKGLYSIPMGLTTVSVNAEDIFLSDADRQLKIRFNPKVSSMKETILETKTDTIGGKYPVFYRNGMVRYREIPISGLISYLMDENNFFISDEELGLDVAPAAAGSDPKVRTTNLVDYNIYAERIFREEVLKWLNNGKPKLFRSPTEGNFVVRLMNVSLSPNDTVGRMLWTFSATAYEMADTEFETLKKLKLLNVQELTPEGTEFITRMWRYGDTIAKNGWFTIKNIVWSSLTPVQHSYMILTDCNDNEYKFYNLTGLFETPKEVVYKNMKLVNIITTDENSNKINDLTYSTINYEISGTAYDAENDNFGNNSTLLKGKWENLQIHNYTNVYYISVTGLSSTNSLITINDNVIDLTDGQTRYYYDLSVANISALTNAIGIIYYGKVVSS